MRRAGHSGFCGLFDGTLSSGLFSHPVCLAVSLVCHWSHLFGRPGHTAVGGLARLGALFPVYGGDCPAGPAVAVFKTARCPGPGYLSPPASYSPLAGLMLRRLDTAISRPDTFPA